MVNLLQSMLSGCLSITARAVECGLNKAQDPDWNPWNPKEGYLHPCFSPVVEPHYEDIELPWDKEGEPVHVNFPESGLKHIDWCQCWVCYDKFRRKGYCEECDAVQEEWISEHPHEDIPRELEYCEFCTERMNEEVYEPLYETFNDEDPPSMIQITRAERSCLSNIRLDSDNLLFQSTQIAEQVQIDQSLALRYVIARTITNCFVPNNEDWPYTGIYSGYRRPDRQYELQRRWDNGDRRGLVTRPASRSYHMLGLAIDVRIPAIVRSYSPPRLDESHPEVRPFMIFVAVMKALGLRWGGDFTRYDPVHFDFPRVKSQSISELISDGYGKRPPQFDLT